VTPTISPTPSPTGVYLTGSVNYSGSVGTVSGTNPIGVEVYTNSSLIKGNGGVSIAAPPPSLQMAEDLTCSCRGQAPTMYWSNMIPMEME
jgi:hypothetical protein